MSQTNKAENSVFVSFCKKYAKFTRVFKDFWAKKSLNGTKRGVKTAILTGGSLSQNLMKWKI